MKYALRVLFACLFVFAGALHFVNTDFYLKIMPPYLPYPKELVLISGFISLVLGVLLMIEKTRQFAAWGIILFLIAVFPANVYMALYTEIFPEIPVWVIWVRLPLQFGLILWAKYYVSASFRTNLRIRPE